jgi:4-hydroxybenzoate polyprenyltransferase
VLGLVRLSHAFPSLLNALATAGIALIAGADGPTATRLGLSMFCLQASIGAVNDLADVELDRVGKPAKPIPAGMVSVSVARAWAAGAGGLGLALAAPSGVVTVAVAAAGVGLGYLYDLWLSRTPLSWLPLTLALPLVPVFAWIGATGDLPAALMPIVPAAVLAGAALILANGTVDLERDTLAGRATIPVRLGRTVAWALHAALFGVAIAVASISAPHFAGPGGPEVVPGVLGVTSTVGLRLGALMVAAGAVLLAAKTPGIRERGWELEGVGTAALGIGWLAGVAGLAGGGAGI